MHSLRAWLGLLHLAQFQTVIDRCDDEHFLRVVPNHWFALMPDVRHVFQQATTHIHLEPSECLLRVFLEYLLLSQE